MKQRLIAILLTVGVLIAGCMGEEGSDVFYGADITPPVPVDDFVLMDEDRKSVV